MKITIRRSLKITLFCFVLLGCVPLAVLAIINSVSASEWVLQQVFALFPEQISASATEGRLRDGIKIENFKLHTESQTVELKHGLIQWQLEDLLSGVLKIKQIKLDDLSVVLKKTDEKSDFDPLAKIELPVQIALDDFSLSNLKIKQDEQSYHIDKLNFSAQTIENELQLPDLTVQGEGGSATVKGKTKLGEGFPFDVSIAWQFNHPEHGQWRGAIQASGDSNKVSFNNQLLAPFIFQQQGLVENVMKEPTLVTNGSWQNLRWPLTGKTVQISSKTGDFKVSGSAKKYQLQLQAALTQTQLEEARLQFIGAGDAENLQISQFNLAAKLGQLQIQGRVGWHDAPQFDLVATGAHFNPAIVKPDLPGDLNFKTALKGHLLADKLSLAVNIDYLSGKLRNYPLLATGQLDLVDKNLTVKAFSLVSGANKIGVQGALGEKNAALDIAITAPHLNSLWATLSGELNANAHLEGALTNPNVLLKAKGKQLRFEQHALQDLAIDLNYAADEQKKSQLQFNANGISSGANQVSTLAFSAVGTKPNHHLTLLANSNQGDIDLAVAGALKNSDWQAQLTKLSLKQAQAGQWQISKAIALAIHKHSAGFDVALGESCFTQAAAKVCVEGSYPATGDFQGAFHALLPSELAQKHLPETLKLSGQLTASGAVQKMRGGLSGNYQLNMSKNTQVTMLVDKQQTTLALNQVSLAGTLQGSQINNDVNLVFADKNYVRGQLRLDTGASQAISGHLSAAVMNFDLLKPYIEPLSELKGSVTAAVDIAGSVKKPELKGELAINDSSVTVEQAGIHLQNITLKLQSLTGEQVLISGHAKSGDGQLNLSGKVQLNPAAGYPAELLITGNQFEVVKLPIAQVLISPELKCVYSKNNSLISGKLSLAKAQIQLQELPKNAVLPSEDEEIIGEEKKNKDKAAAQSDFGVDITIDLGKQTHFSGLGLNTDLVGSLKLTQKADKLLTFGAVDMQKARYKSYGQDLTVRRGRFVFNGDPGNPLLDVEAIRLSKSKKVTAILKLTGVTQTPQAQISSEPPLPESDALAYLVTGRGLNQLTKSDGNMLASAALSYGAGQIAWLAEKFGIDEMELQEGESMKDSLMAVGQYLTPDFYVGAKVGLFSKQTILTLKYKILEGLSVSTQAGESQRAYINYEFSHE